MPEWTFLPETDWNAFWAMLMVLGFFLVGLIGTLAPILPGPVIAWAGIVIHKLWMGEDSVSWGYVGLATFLMALTQVVDYLCTYWGARTFGASWKGGLGALVGGIIGLFFLPIGLIAGPFLGAIAGEIWAGKELQPASRAGLGSLVGGLVALAVKMAITVIYILGFFVALPGDVPEPLEETLDPALPTETAPANDPAEPPAGELSPEKSPAPAENLPADAN